MFTVGIDNEHIHAPLFCPPPCSGGPLTINRQRDRGGRVRHAEIRQVNGLEARLCHRFAFPKFGLFRQSRG